MTAEQQQQYRDLFAAGRFDPDKRVEQYAFQRGWNAGLEFAQEKFDQTTKEGPKT
jgi:hypothetical protein